MKRLLFLLALILIGCGPMINGHSGGGQTYGFVVVVHNQDVAFAETATLSWWQGSTIVGSATYLMPAGGEATFVIGPTPDGIELDTTAHPAQAGGQVYQTPDYWGWHIYHVNYPSGFAWGDFPVQ